MTPLRDPLHMIHAMLTAVALWWSFVLALPGDTFDTSPGYHMFAQTMTEPHWAMVLGAVGAFGVAGIVVPKLCVPATQVLSAAHGTISVMIGMSNPLSTGTGVYATLAIFAGYLVWVRR